MFSSSFSQLVAPFSTESFGGDAHSRADASRGKSRTCLSDTDVIMARCQRSLHTFPIFVGPQCVELFIRGISRRLRKTFQRSPAESGSQSRRCHGASHGRLVGGSCAATRGYLSSAGLIIAQARIISAQGSCDGTAIMGSTDLDACKTTLLSFCRYIWLLTKTNRVPAQTSLSDKGHHGHRVCLGNSCRAVDLTAGRWSRPRMVRRTTATRQR